MDDAAMAQAEEGGHSAATDDHPCPICLESLGEGGVQRIACTHQFHTECIEKWKKQSNTCPVCRKEDGLPPQREDHTRSFTIDTNARAALIAHWCVFFVFCGVILVTAAYTRHGAGTACGYVRLPACVWLVVAPVMITATTLGAPPKYVFTIWTAITAVFLVVTGIYAPSSAHEGCESELIHAAAFGASNVIAIPTAAYCVITRR